MESQATSIVLPELTPAEQARLARDIIAKAHGELRALHEAGGSGPEVGHRFTLVVDRLVSTLFEWASHEYFAHHPRIRHRCAVLAQGGYGRRELSPFSDLDLIFLYPWKASPYVETVAERVLYTLWDAGLDYREIAARSGLKQGAIGTSLRSPCRCRRSRRRRGRQSCR